MGLSSGRHATVIRRWSGFCCLSTQVVGWRYVLIAVSTIDSELPDGFSVRELRPGSAHVKPVVKSLVIEWPGLDGGLQRSILGSPASGGSFDLVVKSLVKNGLVWTGGSRGRF